jgi:hypothetical protein
MQMEIYFLDPVSLNEQIQSTIRRVHFDVLYNRAWPKEPTPG